MKITCVGCAAKYSVPDEKVGDRSFRIRCKRCGEPILVRGTGTAAAAPRVDDDAVFHVMRGGEAEGPLRADQVIAMIASQAIGWDTFVWREGMADWAEARSVSELAELADLDEPAPRSTDVLPRPREAAAPRAVEAASDALTGTRNETSVLFSLANLRDLSKPQGAVNTPRGAAPAPETEGSGLIDIRALATSVAPQARSTNFGAPRAPSESAAIDPLLTLGSPQEPLLGIPVLIAAPRETRSTTPIVGALAAVAIVAVAAAAVVIAVVLNQRPEPVDHTSHVTAPTEEVVDERPTPEGPTVDQQASLTASEPDLETTESPIQEVAAITPPAVERPTVPRPRRPPEVVTIATPDPRPRVIPNAVTEGDPIAEILDGPPRTPTASRPTSNGRMTPTSRDVQASMRQIESRVAACSTGAATMVPVQIVFAGDTGHVRSAEVSNATLSAPVRSCVMQAARGAQVVPFERESFSVRYPFRV